MFTRAHTIFLLFMHVRTCAERVRSFCLPCFLKLAFFRALMFFLFPVLVFSRALCFVRALSRARSLPIASFSSASQKEPHNSAKGNHKRAINFGERGRPLVHTLYRLRRFLLPRKKSPRILQKGITKELSILGSVRALSRRRCFSQKSRALLQKYGLFRSCSRPGKYRYQIPIYNNHARFPLNFEHLSLSLSLSRSRACTVPVSRVRSVRQQISLAHRDMLFPDICKSMCARMSLRSRVGHERLSVIHL